MVKFIEKVLNGNEKETHKIKFVLCHTSSNTQHSKLNSYIIVFRRFQIQGTVFTSGIAYNYLTVMPYNVHTNIVIASFIILLIWLGKVYALSCGPFTCLDKVYTLYHCTLYPPPPHTIHPPRADFVTFRESVNYIAQMIGFTVKRCITMMIFKCKVQW